MLRDIIVAFHCCVSSIDHVLATKERHKKMCFFWKISEIQRPQFFLIRKFWNWQDPPPSFGKKFRIFFSFLWKNPYGLGETPPFGKNIQESPALYDNTLLEYVRPPPFKKKIQKNLSFFLIRKFRIRRDPPAPLSEFFWKKTVFFLCLPLVSKSGCVTWLMALCWGFVSVFVFVCLWLFVCVWACVCVFFRPMMMLSPVDAVSEQIQLRPMAYSLMLGLFVKRLRLNHIPAIWLYWNWG